MLFFLFFFFERRKGKHGEETAAVIYFFNSFSVGRNSGKTWQECGGKRRKCKKRRVPKNFLFFFFLRRVGRGFHLYISFTAATAVAIAVVGAVADVDVGAAEGKVHRELRTKNIFFHSSTFLSPLIEKFLLLKKKKFLFF